MAGVFTGALVAILFSMLVNRSAANYYGAQASPARSYSSAWLPAKATWYGAPTGAGPANGGGACAYSNNNLYPILSMNACGNQPLFMDGAGCGTCYEIKCDYKNNRACSGQPKRVTITDMNYNNIAQYYFDLSGTAFGAMAKYGQNENLRRAGILDIQFRRVPCNYQGMNINFRVERGSNNNYLAVLVQHANKDGNVVQVDLKDSGSYGSWTPMKRSWGAIWRMDTGRPLKAPFSFRMRSEFGATKVAYQVIPVNWKGGNNYWSNVQY
ncbi:expansin-B2 [Brachypodium distachyon]|uniref:Expansin-like EG45 domain-containing protein n=1 Tax=Brachypodium distachyon TaxID=15368 RepID=I1I630_BRADI|nr:expansin-B2 [Brachypodium distachyon]KQJ97765.1 hypothetical protein BRADI_3g33130v3 [Brachypodium distachyon]|eukprot:XP_003574316.1 expansin-B2 [Brachypodium distachyon]